MEDTIRIDVITGFLGAGKTTFIKELMVRQIFSEEKVVLIENEFGSVSVDQMILQNDRYDLIEISGGCICCSLKGDIIEALEALGENEKPDRVVIEPSGVFVVEDLYGIMNHESIRNQYSLGGIYTIVDSRHFLIDKMRHAPFFSSQLKYADHILISKTESQNEADLEEVLDGLPTFNDKANIYSVPFSKLTENDMEQLMNSKPIRSLDQDQEMTNHHIQMSTLGIFRPKSLQREDLMKLFERIGNGSYGEVVRMKGFMEVDGHLTQVDYVSGELTLQKVGPNHEAENVMTVIGYGLNSLKIRSQFSVPANPPFPNLKFKKINR